MPRMRVLLGVPSNGTLTDQSATASFLCSFDHDVTRIASTTQGLNFNPLWADALTRGMRGEIDYFAMMHADLSVVDSEPGRRWLDILVEELERADVPFLSVPNAIKDARGVTSCGVGDPADRWHPFRRFTLRELEAMPLTFQVGDTPHPDKFLLHNEAMCLADMRDTRWYYPDEVSRCRFHFHVEEEIRLGETGRWERRQETEDWSFSRDLWKAGMDSAITRRVKLYHLGQLPYPNWGEVGLYENGDEDSADKWRQPSTLTVGPAAA